MIAAQGWRSMELFDNIWKLVGVPVITVQLRYNGWVTEMRVLQTLCEYSSVADASYAAAMSDCCHLVTIWERTSFCITARRIVRSVCRRHG